MQKVLVAILFAFVVVNGQFAETVTATTVNGVSTFRAVAVNDILGRALSSVGVSVVTNGKNTTINAVEFLLNTFLETTLQFNYFSAATINNAGQQTNPGPSNTMATDYALAFRAFSVFEFVNNDGVPGFQESNGPNHDTITGAYDLSSALLKWNPLKISTLTLTGSQGSFNVTTAVAQTADNVFLIKLIFTQSPITVNGTVVTSDQVKISFQINWFNNTLNVPSLFSTGPSQNPNAQVGLAAIAASLATGYSKGNTPGNGNSQSLSFNSNTYKGAFSYATTAGVVVNGVASTTTVIASESKSSTNANINMNWAGTWTAMVEFFSFSAIRPAVVNWDPVMGAASTTGTNAGASHFLSLFAILALLFINF